MLEISRLPFGTDTMAHLYCQGVPPHRMQYSAKRDERRIGGRTADQEETLRGLSVAPMGGVGREATELQAPSRGGHVPEASYHGGGPIARLVAILQAASRKRRDRCHHPGGIRTWPKASLWLCPGSDHLIHASGHRATP